MGYKIYQNAGSVQFTDAPAVAGTVTQPALGAIRVKNEQFGGFNKTLITLDNVGQTVVNGTEYQGTKIFTFPEGRVLVLGVTATLKQKTTSALAGTLNASSTGAISLGTVTASATTLATTMVDLLPTTAFTSSATVNVSGTAVSAALAASAQFDGTTTAKPVFLNTAYATTGNVVADATQTVSGTVAIAWVFLGDY